MGLCEDVLLNSWCAYKIDANYLLSVKKLQCMGTCEQSAEINKECWRWALCHVRILCLLSLVEQWRNIVKPAEKWISCTACASSGRWCCPFRSSGVIASYGAGHMRSNCSMISKSRCRFSRANRVHTWLTRRPSRMPLSLRIPHRS